MRLKTLQAPTMAEAMRLVRDELGENAIIVSTTENRRDGVRITAAVEAPDADLDFQGMETEDALVERITETLDSHRVPRELADRVASVAAELGTTDILQTLAGALDLVFEFKPLSHAETARPLLFFGPPGAGKTSIIAKIAARAILEQAPVTMVTTDTVRAGAVQQLEAYGKRLNAPVRTADTPEALAEVMREADGRLVLIDTTSVNPFLTQDVAQLRAYTDSADYEGILIMSAGREPLEAQDMAAEFRKFAPDRLLVTGLDMSRRLGGILSALQASGAAFAEISATADIVDGVRPVNPVMLARLLLEITNARAPADGAVNGAPQTRQATGWK
jgi:flagellar biosynthesis protein FlhF